MNIVLNFVPLKSGGGLQIGLDFIKQAKQHGIKHQWFLVGTQGTPIANSTESSNFHLVYTVPNSIPARLWFEYIGCRRLIKKVKADVVYTQFGPHWPGSTAPNIVGCAYSNLFYPEIDFWEKASLPARLFRKAVDLGRMRRLRQADHVIFETKDLADRAVRLKAFPRQRISWVKPSVSSLVTPNCEHRAVRDLCTSLRPGYRVLLLSTYNPNKNIDLIPDILRALEDTYRTTDVMFVLTLPLSHRGTKRILEKARGLGVSDRIINVGPVPQEACVELYRSCDAVILASQLESFSNTIAEAWTMEKPLIVSDLEWARSLCDSGAVYFTYNDPIAAASAIYRLKEDACFRNDIVSNGRTVLLTYPRPEQRFGEYLTLIEQYGTLPAGS
jgi:glycosyltransferase involved in cell wall biosynthesis